MKNDTAKIAFGGGCHWCTEAVFQQLKGVSRVEQGFVASVNEYQSFSEAVIVHFNPSIIPLKILVEIHLYTHKSTSNHSMLSKYRSAIYYFTDEEKPELELLLKAQQVNFEAPLITKVLKFNQFEASREQITNYYKKNPNKPFCEIYIHPKLKLLQEQFSNYVKT